MQPHGPILSGAMVIQAGEELPLAVVFGRKSYKTGNAYYDKMAGMTSGLPSGWRMHWQTIDPPASRI